MPVATLRPSSARSAARKCCRPDGDAQISRDLQAASAHVPHREQVAEARPLHEELRKIQQGRRRGPQLLGDILPIVLARLGVGVIQSNESGE
jgi:hypothetical protein